MKPYLLAFCLILFLVPSKAQNLERHLKDLFSAQSSKSHHAIQLEIIQLLSENEKLKALPKNKKVKKIYSAIEKNFLKRYVSNAFFSEIQFDQSYSALTGAILTGIIFEEMEIPFKVRVDPTSIELIAYPISEEIILEMDGKNASILFWTESAANIFLNHMVRQDLVTEKTITNQGGNNYVNATFHDPKELTLDQIIGLYYINACLNEMHKENYEKALELIDIGYKKYTFEAHLQLKASVLSKLIYDSSEEDIMLSEYLAELYPLAESISYKEKLAAHFQHAYFQALIEREDSVFMHHADEAIEKYAKGNDGYEKLKGETYFLKAYKAGLKDDSDAALDYLMTALMLQPENHHFQDLLGDALLAHIIDKDYSNEVLLDSIIVYSKKFPFLKEYDDFYSHILGHFYEVVGDYFLANDSALGFDFLDRLSEINDYGSISDMEELQLDKAWMYSEIATYYYRRKDYQQALEWVEKAEKLAPDDSLIQRRSNQIRKFTD
jgi:tetratricopeptide (TPR) repeat protein